MKNLDLFNQERLKKNEMQNVRGGGLPGPYIGIQTPEQNYQSSCVCAAWCDGSDHLLFEYGRDMRKRTYTRTNY